MSENPYTRTLTVEIVELVPERDRLPTCVGVVFKGSDRAYICGFHARYMVNGKPVCGLHARASTMFVE